MSNPEDVRYVTFSPNGGSGSMASQTFKIGAPQVLATNAFKREGWVFRGWNTEYDGTGESYENGDSFVFGAHDTDVTMYAMWYPFGSYKVMFVDSFDGTTKTQTVDYDKPVELKTISELGFHHDGYAIGEDESKGWTTWNTKKNGSGTKYKDGQELFNAAYPGETITLYTQWQGKIKYNKNGADSECTGDDRYQSFILFNPVTLLDNDDNHFKKHISAENADSITFAMHGWAEKKSNYAPCDFLKFYKGGETIKEGFSENKTLYVRWGYEYPDGHFTVYEDLNHYYKPDYYSVWGHGENCVNYYFRNVQDYIIVATGPVYDKDHKLITVKVGDGPYCYVSAYSDMKYRKFTMNAWENLTDYYKEPGTDVILLLSVRVNSSYELSELPLRDYMTLWGNPLVHTENDKLDYALFTTLFGTTDVSVYSGSNTTGSRVWAATTSSIPFWSEKNLNDGQTKYVLTALY